MANYIHPFGYLPSNPDNFPENELYGQGTERPIGLSFSEIFKLVWTVRSFNCNFATILQNDPLSQFLSNGPININGAIASLNNINLGSTDAISGITTITTSFRQKQRKGTRSNSDKIIDIYTWDGILNGNTQTSISIGNNQKTFLSKNKKVYEGTILSGPVHTLLEKVTIDFSNIKYRKNLYWPRIIINTNFSSSIRRGAPLLGGISFNNNLINMYSNDTQAIFRIAYGSIIISNDINNRFTYDNKDYYN